MHLDALPPAIRRSPRAALEAQKHRHHRTLVFDESDEELDEAAPPPIARSRSASIDGELSKETPTRADSSSRINPLRSHPVEEPPPKNPARKFSRPFRELEPQEVRSPDPVEPPTSRRHPRGLVSYRNNKREFSNIRKLPPHLRRQTSLETINSVTTTASDDASQYGHDPPEVEAPSTDWFTLQDDPPCNPPLSITSKPSSMHSSSGSSRQSPLPVETPLEFASLDHNTPQSLFRKMMPRRMTDKMEQPPPSPTRLIIEKSTSIDRTSHRSTHSKSTTSLPASSTVSMSDERSLQSILGNVDRSRSGSKSSSSSKWSASDFDISTLTETEIKRCRKKGINPALYAEMKAAKKGKWTSPIAGNTFL
ncbi:hypothetical protein BDW02DRAFT_234000 [Decorospora gaudefroyi]|uniref:Uncharacterized protein n=1 Tax=Decorospora gaudefroyi TaxID=184978 RepID=A0A6A5KV83_9PLEO|nr:hypothetical protein BDW02DRAFT_234000 [Decorospora gaudefroyi]